MVFETLEDYNAELRKIRVLLNEMEEYMKTHPEKIGYANNYKTLKHVYNLIECEKSDFIKKINEINLKLNGKLDDNSMSVNNLSNLSNKFSEIKYSTTNLLDNSNISNDYLLIKEISEGSYNIKFAFPNPTEEDVKRTSLRKRGLMKLFDLIDCGDDINQLIKEAGPNGREVLIKYKEFLEEIVKNNVDFTLDTENGCLQSGLTLKESENICKNLKL